MLQLEEYLVGVPGGVGEWSQQQTPQDQTKNTQTHDDATLRLLVQMQLGKVREAHEVAECVGHERCDKVTRSQKQEGRVCTKQSGV